MTCRNNNIGRKAVLNIVVGVLLLTSSVDLYAMPGWQHFDHSRILLETPIAQGGAIGISPEKLRSMQKWIDNPANKTGQYMNRATGTSVTPSNHGHLRHNPAAVARAMSGNGTIDPGILNLARLHKIQDVAHNTAAVDGWTITPQMRQEASDILAHIEKKKGLPKQLPDWVDQSGPLLKSKPASVGLAANESAKAGSASNADDAGKSRTAVARKASRIAGRVALVVGVGVELVVRGKDSYEVEQQFQGGEISAQRRNEAHAENLGGCIGGAGGAWALAKGGALGGFAVGGPVGAVIGGVGGGLIGGFGGDYVGSQMGRWVGGL